MFGIIISVIVLITMGYLILKNYNLRWCWLPQVSS